MQLTAKIREARASLSRRRTERLAHRRLGAELAAFTSVADRTELESILERHPAKATEEIRAILLRQDASRQYAATALGSRN